MKLYKTLKGFVIENEGQYYLSKHQDWDLFINRDELYYELSREVQRLNADYDLIEVIQKQILPPIQSQEVWAAGVTYLRSKNARMEESKDAGGGDFYDRVYDAPRPELFLKATANRVMGHKQNVRIRKDSKWNVPEPELTLFVNSKAKITAYTVGNDVSSRDIEGENPLYLPQAKCYDKSAALGPCLLVLDEPIDSATEIKMDIRRGKDAVFSQKIQLNQMKRKLPELVSYLCSECTFEHGVFLMTGTGIIPEDEFTLKVGDVVDISIENIGTLSNTIESK
ncbi:fumarylacetoacetate hydrolase family protein [Marinilongibacter aquaticus]|uniref:fumarylacetoacetate hydrolase family protein n=1 Tax=Marinilongibacter aquaticus TaxID=2975157 RepID=UPI0021BDBF42|nr:fumarylacetoacetate hydrolase family protein [Marinilongibacter aquaticus]UBM57782.1 fumarylacetoacetate hydrolase family protein [Marinilongibacter aquaticus]